MKRLAVKWLLLAPALLPPALSLLAPALLPLAPLLLALALHLPVLSLLALALLLPALSLLALALPWWWVETSCGEVVVSSSSVEPESSSSEVVVESSSSEVVVESSSSEVVVESSSSETPVSSSSVEPESSSSEIVVSACIAFENGKGDYDKNCYNSGLRGMAEGKCYTMNPDRVKEGVPQWINEEASQTWWWVETPCDATVVKKALGRDNGTTRIVAAAEVKANMAVVHIDLISVTGSVLKSFDKNATGSVVVRFSGVPSGLYVVRVKNAGITNLQKIKLD